MSKQNRQVRNAAGVLIASLVLATGMAGAQTVAVPGVGLGAGARVESGGTAGVAVPPTGGVTNSVGGVVSNTTGTVGGTLHNATGAAGSGTAAVRQQGAGVLRQAAPGAPGAMGTGARVDGSVRGSGAVGIQK